MKYNIFKYKMQLYREYIFRIEDLEIERDDIFYTFYGVHGISFDRIPSSHSVEMDIAKRDKFNSLIENIDLELKNYRESIDEYEQILSSLPEEIQRMVRRKFLDGCTYYQLGKEFGYTPTGVMKHIQKEVEKL